MSVAVYLIMVIVLLVVRFALNKFLDTKSAKVRFGIGVGIFIVYTGIVQLFFYYRYQEIANTGGNIQELYQSMAMIFAVISLAVIFIAFVYFFMRNKRGMSDMDKMKLKDM